MSKTTEQTDQFTRHLQASGAVLLNAGTATPATYISNGNVRAAAIEALDVPLDFPPLARSIVPGDRVAIAVDESVPQLVPILAGVIESFQRAGVEASDVTIVAADAGCHSRLQTQIPKLLPATVALELHDPADSMNLCFVGVLQSGEALRINRTIFDADVVLPIGCARLHEVFGSAGVFDSVFPRFSDVATLRRWRDLENLDSFPQAARQEEADEAGWLLGAPLVMEVVPGPGDTVSAIVSGMPTSVASYSNRLCQELWAKRFPQRASLVIARLSGQSHDGSWEDFGRALAAAEPLLDEHGALAVYSNIATPPGKSLQRLAGADDFEIVQRQLAHESHEDTWSAWQLARALERGPVYLLSHLDADTIEDLGMAPVVDEGELARLASRHESCIVLDDAEHVVAHVEDHEP